VAVQAKALTLPHTLATAPRLHSSSSSSSSSSSGLTVVTAFLLQCGISWAPPVQPRCHCPTSLVVPRWNWDH
jgi:hypothetical protein